MHDLLLLRHAAALPSSPDGTDSGRPLSVLGEQEARQAGRWMREHEVQPTCVVSSPARRAMMTANAAMAELGLDGDPILEASIYDAVPGTLIQVLERHADAGPLLLVGHNPGLEQLVGLLVQGSSSLGRGMPPAGIAWLRSPLPLQPGESHLHAFWSP